MREHKYRIWDAKNKGFVYFNLRRLVGHWSETIFDPEEPSTQSNDREGIAGVNGKGSLLASAPLDKYTGLKDENGVEIWEGDIIELYNGRKYELIYQPRWGGYELAGLYDRETLGDKVSDWSAVVIGNIYENPELLETK